MGSLLVIDRSDMRNMWKELLQVREFRSIVRDESFRVEECSTAPGIVLIDIDAFPAASQGFSVVEDLRADYPETSIIVMMTEPLTMAQRAYEAGASACLPKPLDYAVILKLLDLMARSESPREETKVSLPVPGRQRGAVSVALAAI
jgi:DNA-binding response OmpR family regulator